jgi:hypothetical protein
LEWPFSRNPAIVFAKATQQTPPDGWFLSWRKVLQAVCRIFLAEWISREKQSLAQKAFRGQIGGLYGTTLRNE